MQLGFNVDLLLFRLFQDFFISFKSEFLLMHPHVHKMKTIVCFECYFVVYRFMNAIIDHYLFFIFQPKAVVT